MQAQQARSDVRATPRGLGPTRVHTAGADQTVLTGVSGWLAVVAGYDL